MKVCAPAKVLLTGAYAVLHGAPAIVRAVDRYAVASAEAAAGASAGASRRSGLASSALSPEFRAAFPEGNAPAVDTTALFQRTADGPRKLGLGSSAAALVAALGLRRARRGDDLGDPAVRDELFRAAFDAHRQAQGGGSGVDIAASVFGGTRIYRRVAVPAADREKPPSLRIPPVALPPGVVVDVWFSGTSARTASLRALVDTFAADAPREFALCMERLVSASHDAVSACERFDSDAFVEAVRSAEEGLRALGAGARAPIVTEPFAVLGAAARGADGAFVPSGAGGGDVGLWVGRAPPPAAFCARARSLGFSSLGLGEAKEGVRIYTPDDDGFPAHGRDAER